MSPEVTTAADSAAVVSAPRDSAAQSVPQAEPGGPAAPPETARAPTTEASAAADGIVPSGTEIHAALVDSLHSRRDSAGTVINARVMQSITDRTGSVFIPADALVQLTVTQFEPAGSRSAADGKLEMRVDGIHMGGELRTIDAEVRAVPHELRGRGVTGSEAGKVAAGTAAGAVAGRVIGGNTKGAVIGGVVGAAAGAAVAAQTADRDIIVHPRTPIVLVLRAPLVAVDGH
jgi:hypothetical protein